RSTATAAPNLELFDGVGSLLSFAMISAFSQQVNHSKRRRRSSYFESISSAPTIPICLPVNGSLPSIPTGGFTAGLVLESRSEAHAYDRESRASCGGVVGCCRWDSDRCRHDWR